MRLLCLLAAAGLAAPVAMPAAAQQQPPKLSKCTVGQRVKTPGSENVGVVTSLLGSACVVRVQTSYSVDERAWAPWMLTAADGGPGAPAAPVSATPQTGQYQCYGGPAGNMKLSFGGGATYANEQGKQGRYTIGQGGQIAFVSGPWAGFYAKVLGPGKVGLTSKPNQSFYYMTCDRR